jgi:branched-chain amino acid transport system substrate-binding protein
VIWSIVVILSLTLFIRTIHTNKVANENSQVLKIGVILPFTGRFASISEDIKNGLELAAKDSQGKVEYVFEDSVGEPQKGISGILNVIQNQKVQVALSGPGSTVNIAMSPVAEKFKTPYFAISATPELMGKDDYIFTVQPSVTREVLKMSEFLRSTYADMNKVAVVYDATSDTLTTGSTLFAEDFSRRGGEVVLKEGYGKDIQYNSVATKVLIRKPEIVYVLGVDKVAGPIVKAIIDLGYTGKIAGFSGIESDEFLKATKSGAEGILMTSVPFSCESSVVTSEYCKEYTSRFNRVPQQYGAYAYDVVMMLGELYNSCVLEEGRKMKECITDSTSKKSQSLTLTNSFGFSETGDLSISIPILIKKIQGEKFVVVE